MQNTTLKVLDMIKIFFKYINIVLTDQREQMNLASSYLDGSAFYGPTDESTELLRTYDAGLVNISACAECSHNALYAALLNEHNRLAIALQQLNRHWTDEVLYLEARRILVAEIQHITYNEYLTTVLGEVKKDKIFF